MPVIAMTQEMGSLAKDVALELASTLNIAVMRHEVVDHVAGKMHVPSSLIKRLREGHAGLVERLTTDRDSLALYSAEEVYELASKGNVVLRGWGATCLLRPVPHVVCVRITRSFDKRVEWLMNHLESGDQEFAEQEIRRSDHAHAARMQHQFGVHWGDPVLYDLVLNTDRLSVATCVEQIRQLCNRPEFQETAASRQMIADLSMAAHVRAALKSNASTAEVKITVQAEHGRLALSGIVVNAAEEDAVLKTAAAVAGVTGVDNGLRLMKAPRSAVRPRG